ncbi:MAG: heme lyase CcmF/NrfE family subunit [Candidatus Neomarinimicrobiota bacterium]
MIPSMPTLGAVAQNLALGFALLTILLLIAYLRTGDYRLFRSGQRAALIVSALVILSTLVLLLELLHSNFNVAYVAHYTSTATPLLYKISALWAGQAGSLLFWVFVLSIYSLVVILQNRHRNQNLMPWVILILAVTQFFFLTMTNFVTNPFEPVEAGIIVREGNGLNPLLQNVTMAIHPPTLYLGFVGFTIPFAFAMAALIVGDTSAAWIRLVRRWTLVTWLALSIGIILGAWWAYQELGWGGYWAWDPVENASFMPWLTATAFIHSIIIQEKRDMLRVWNMILIIVTFALSIFGTFLTRSGIMSSVHSFTASSLGPLFLIFVGLILLVSFLILAKRLPLLRTANRIESFASRESGFLFNNVVFIVMCFAVFWGTMFPVLSEAVRGTKITVGPPFFNQVNIPIGLALLLLTGIGPLLAWRRTSRASLTKLFTIPVGAGLVVMIALLLAGIRGYTMIAFDLTAFVAATIILEFYRGIAVRRRKHGETILQAFRQLINKNRNRYGGYIVHFGVVLMFVGFTGTAFDKETENVVKEGDSFHLGGYDFILNRITTAERSNHFAWIADISVNEIDGGKVTRLFPEKRIYFHRDPDQRKRQPHSELDIYTTLRQDIYSVFTGIDTERNAASLKIMINPLVTWVWIGGYIFVLGTLIALWPARRKQ